MFTREVRMAPELMNGIYSIIMLFTQNPGKWKESSSETNLALKQKINWPVYTQLVNCKKQ